MTWRKLKGINKNDRSYLTKNLWFDWRLFIDTWWFIEMQSLWLEYGGFFPLRTQFCLQLIFDHLLAIMVLGGPTWFDYKTNRLGKHVT